MLEKIIDFSVKHKLIVILFTISIVVFGVYAIVKIPVGTVPDITNNQVQIITTSGNLSTQEIEQFITIPVEMEMANLPGVVEIRSISKFGISVVTVVFEERMGTYLPRQLIAEKIKSASANIPEAYGTPEMGPISTGLGEIYQYIVDVKPGYEGRYSAMELRTIQDWVIKRRLSGINGVVEINSWGGYLKQYEVAIDPFKLKSMGVSLIQVFEALEKNNGITGGSYIEKTNQSYFIRGDGLVKSLSDIENILVERNEGVPILVKDIAEVGYGHANRYGAITANGKGETVLGQIMMLKDANSKEVIREVKRRVAEIQENLPEGVFVNPILERSELIAKTSTTVAENLILGAIIVILIVLLLLGNLRSALVIGSMIPLALLFTLSMMYLFGVDANLMSLGALDFGIIIDGAVIIVEYIAIKITLQQKDLLGASTEERRTIMDKIAFVGSTKMMKSAIFGQVIILIVFIPILSLTGVEGKMFRPMALAFSFAIIGAMIMGLTWLPVASSLFLRPAVNQKPNFSDKLMAWVQRSYEPVIEKACKHKRLVLGSAIIMLLFTGGLFYSMGGEFVPTLDEGDFVIQPVLKTGTSLSKTVETTTQMENILIKNFPDEVDQIVCRIGAAEVPTDPMGMEEIDMIIKLHPKNTWVKAGSKEQLADRFKEALEIIPGIEYEFTQPIEMRFNELITGVRSDIAIKIFGEDLDYISKKANEIRDAIADVEGAGDIILEKTTGLPQVKVSYNRSKIAYYGVDVNRLNNYLSAAFGGKIIGVVFEGERRFDMVMRFNQDNRTDISNISALQVPLPNGSQVPFSELGEIEYTTGPAKISRDNTHRRVVVAVNVRKRDLQSVIRDIQSNIEAKVQLQPGTYVEYGGQFENLQNATKRLMLAVPVAMLLIFVFLHFAFGSLKDAIMIYTAIPLSAVGGVLLLWLRGMPFSVSAGVGFIALFGVAVLNGIVLIEHLKELQRESKYTMRELIIKGSRDRLRPVMLTAGAAAMGFLPMAISTGAGAEVQRPLATVVIGGLITSTMLTMIALPLMFELFYNVKAIKFFPFRVIRSKTTLLLLLLLTPILAINAQQKKLDLDEIIEIALQNNQQIAAYNFKVEHSKALKKTSFDVDKTTLSYSTDENNIAENGHPLKVWAITQEFSFPTLYLKNNDAQKINISIAQTKLELKKNALKKAVSQRFYKCQMLKGKHRVYMELDSLFARLDTAAQKRINLEDISRLEALHIKSKRNEIEAILKAVLMDIKSEYKQLKTLMNTQADFEIAGNLTPAPMSDGDNSASEMEQLFQYKNNYSRTLMEVEKQKLLPDLSLHYFIGSNTYDDAQNYHGFEIGVAVPLFFGNHSARVKAAKLSNAAMTSQNEYNSEMLKSRLNKLQNERLKYKALLQNYEAIGKELQEEIMRTSLKSYEMGQIDFFQFINGYENALKIRTEYLNNLFDYNRLTTELMYVSE
ncbi:cobalt-zinc-cadmium resistance protein CzcA [Saccharicrinis carchari]|uniref:Cobalt-zinc-cadmium resistance protein CzcA n=1 Tax=Saccharicrinis carchari TaxID=1168039 RepID=A0A521D5J3_SACCC|nr:CusA/CzcA family heavy metal efflux RND transporter [Saccharicrinis carchari]SMO66947.1 cobalt-zinc-cadmium resistance protein CzcA [Saccharicrinis carchari]